MSIIWEKNIKELSWTVTSNKMDKTVVITVNSVKTHPLYKKRYIVKKKYYAHDEDNACTVGQVVKIRQSRPLSKLKRRVVVHSA